MTLILEASHLSFAYAPGQPVFDGLNLAISAGESAGLIGGNGSGKSTLLWCLLGLLKARGEIRLFGEKWNKRALQRIGVVFQNPEDQLFMPSVAEDIQLALHGFEGNGKAPPQGPWNYSIKQGCCPLQGARSLI